MNKNFKDLNSMKQNSETLRKQNLNILFYYFPKKSKPIKEKYLCVFNSYKTTATTNHPIYKPV